MPIVLCTQEPAFRTVISFRVFLLLRKSPFFANDMQFLVLRISFFKIDVNGDSILLNLFLFPSYDK